MRLLNLNGCCYNKTRVICRLTALMLGSRYRSSSSMSIYPAPQLTPPPPPPRRSYGFCHHRQRPVGCACPAGCRLDVVCRAKWLCLCADADADPDGPATSDTHPGCPRNACRRRHAHASGICRYPCRRHDGGCTAACQTCPLAIKRRRHWPPAALCSCRSFPPLARPGLRRRPRQFLRSSICRTSAIPAHQPRRRCRRRPSMCRRHLCLCRPVLRRLSPHRPLPHRLSPRLPSRRP